MIIYEVFMEHGLFFTVKNKTEYLFILEVIPL